MKVTTIKKIITLLLANSAAFACTAEPQKSKGQAESLPQEVSDQTQVVQDPNLANVDIVSEPTLVKASSGSTLEVPGFEFKLTGAEFVQILRCSESYKFLSNQGTDLTKSDISSLSSTELEGGWMRAWNAQEFCEVVGTRVSPAAVTREKFVDLTAGQGSVFEQRFFYILNPCVAEKHSSTPGRHCSFRLAHTLPILYKAKHQMEFVTLARTLLNLESELTGKLFEIQSLAKASTDAMEKCNEDKNAFAAWQSRKAGLANIISFGVSTFVGSVITGPLTLALGSQVSGVVNAAFGASDSFVSTHCKNIAEFAASAEKASASVMGLLEQVKQTRQAMSRLETTYDNISAEVTEEIFQ